MTYLLDTNILIGVVTGRKAHAVLLQGLVDERHLLATCAIVVAETFAGVRPAEETRTAALLESLEFLPATYDIARRAGLIRRDFAKTKGRSLSLADATIAAIAMANAAVVITENRKDFEIPGLRVLEP